LKGQQAVEEARASYEAGDAVRAREIALAGLAAQPDDPALLRLAGLASLELGDGDAVGYLERAAALDPDDSAALVDLGHTLYAQGRAEEAISVLLRGVEHDPGSADAHSGLVHIYRREGRLEEALAVAQRLEVLDPEDVVAALDVAELGLELGRLDDAAAAFGRVRGLDDDPDHDVYANHGLIEVEIRRERWRRALDIAVDTTRVDRLGLTTDVLAFLVGQVFGDSDRPSPSRPEVEQALERTRLEHRRLHTQTL
jgi:tetratricopeptide (TPR) repeat protein